MVNRLTLKDWSERDERRFQRLKYRLLKARLQQAENDNIYDSNSNRSPYFLRSNSSFDIAIRKA